VKGVSGGAVSRSRRPASGEFELPAGHDRGARVVRRGIRPLLGLGSMDNGETGVDVPMAPNLELMVE